MALYMESTKIEAAKTAGEIQELLIQAGAVGILTELADGRITGLTFMLRVGPTDLPFRLPVRVLPVHKILQSRRPVYRRAKYEKLDLQQAERVAWRQLLRWIQAQLAMIDTKMVKAEEVFLPYIRLATGETWFERLEATQFKALPAPAAAESGGRPA